MVYRSNERRTIPQVLAFGCWTAICRNRVCAQVAKTGFVARLTRDRVSSFSNIQYHPNWMTRPTIRPKRGLAWRLLIAAILPPATVLSAHQPALLQRFSAAFLAISLRRFAVVPAARALPTMRHGAGVLAVLGGDVLNLASGDLGDHDGVADGFGGGALAFRSAWRELRFSHSYTRNILRDLA